MKKLVFVFGVMVLLVGLLMPSAAIADGPETKVYADVTLSNWGQGNFPEIWDLTECDLTLSYTIDMSAIVTAGWAVTEVGVREVCAPNIDPNLQGGWMQSNHKYGTSNPNLLNDNDMHLLSKHGWLYQQYDVNATDPDTLITPYWSNNNYGFWFDRDGVDEWQAAMWGMDDGGIYNTNGVYAIVINCHAIDDDTGTMCATINGVQQGLYVGGWKDAQPEFYPAGRSFEGDMTQLQVFYGRGGGGGTVALSDITVTGCLRMVIIDGCNTGVVDQVLDGCSTISGKIAECAVDARNHGEFVSCVSHLTNELKKAGCITGEEKGKIVSCAARADIPPCVVEGTVGTGWSDTAVNCTFALVAKYGDADASSTVPGDDGGCYPELAVQGGIPGKNVLTEEQFGWADEQFYPFRAEYDGAQTASITLNGVKAEATSSEILDPTLGEMAITVKTTNKWQEPGTKVVVRNLTLNACSVNPDGISAVKPEGEAREIKYIQLTGLDLSGGFVLEGEIMLDWETPHTRFYREAFGMNIDVR